VVSEIFLLKIIKIC